MSGHYISLPRGATFADMQVPLIMPGVAGLQLRLPWVQLEPDLNNYQFGFVEWVCAVAAEHGRRVVVMIEDKTFNAFENPAPPYLRDFALANKRDGYTMARWMPEVYLRQRALADALRAENFPGFGGIAFQETAPGLEQNILDANGYTAARYQRAILSLSHSCDFLYLNYIPGKGEQWRLGDIINNAACAVGGPDILPDSDKLNEHVYPHFKAAENHVIHFCSMQFHSFNHKKPNGTLWTLKELVQWARDRDHLRVSTIFWNIVFESMPGASMDDAYKVIAEIPRL